MHRSGTSLTAHILDYYKIDFGNDTMYHNYFNTCGYYENEDFVNFHNNLLNNLNCSWINPPEHIKLEIEFNKNINIIKDIISKNNSNNWGFKDPRMCLFLEFYLKNKLLNNLKILVCLRNPLEIAKSINYRDKISILDALKLNNYYNKILFNTLSNFNNSNILYINYENYYNEKQEAQINLIKEFINTDKPFDYSIIKYNIKDR